MINKLNNNYANLPEHFYEVINPTSVKNPKLVLLNDKLLKTLDIDLDNLKEQEIADIFSGNVLIEGSKPIALAYAGHQYGHFVPQLGDGRAVLLGDVVDITGNRLEVQLKGSGQTRFSRRGDGRSPLGPALREYIISEFMHSLNIPTTRSLAVVTTGEKVIREKILPGGILTRLSRSHVRVGTFEYFAAKGDIEAIKTLADYMIQNYYPAASKANNPYKNLLELIIEAQAHLIAKWLSIGFIHGVMNTDNTSIVGETIDYGPCAFMDEFDPTTVFSSIDRHGRYAYNNQVNIARWNMSILAQCFLPMLSNDIEEATNIAIEAIASFIPTHRDYWLKAMGAKIGVKHVDSKDSDLIESLLALMNKYKADFTLSFRYLSTTINSNSENFTKLFNDGPDIHQWLERWRQRLKGEKKAILEIEKGMNLVNPCFIPRNHLVQQAIEAAENKNDFTKVESLINVLAEPYNDDPANDQYRFPPKSSERVCQTFCGT